MKCHECLFVFSWLQLLSPIEIRRLFAEQGVLAGNLGSLRKAPEARNMVARGNAPGNVEPSP